MLCSGHVLVRCRCQIDSAKGEPRLSVQCNQAVELELGLHGLQKVHMQS